MTPEELDRLLDSMEVKLEDLFTGPDRVSDVGVEGESNPFRSARYDLLCGDCGAKMELISTAKYKRPFYGCSRFPDCRGTIGARSDGSPLGTPTNAEGREARIEAHAVFDLIWKSKTLSRGDAYLWMQKTLGMTPDQAHIAMFTKDQCQKLIKLVREAFPHLPEEPAPE